MKKYKYDLCGMINRGKFPITKGWFPKELFLKSQKDNCSHHVASINGLIKTLEESGFEVSGPYSPEGANQDIYNIYNSKEDISITLLTNSVLVELDTHIILLGSDNNKQDFVSKILQLKEVVRNSRECGNYWSVY